MIEIEKLQQYYRNDKVRITAHCAERCRSRGIEAADIRAAVTKGEIIEQYPEDFPFPSCLVYGKDEGGRILHVCMSDNGEGSEIITAYEPNKDKQVFADDLKTRLEKDG